MLTLNVMKDVITCTSNILLQVLMYLHALSYICIGSF